MSKKNSTKGKYASYEVKCMRCHRPCMAKGTSPDSKMICWRCVMLMVEPPVIKQPVKKEFRKPQGWQFLNEYVDPEGNVYFKGVMQEDLKGTKEATVVVAKPKKRRDKQAEKELQHKTSVEILKLKKRIQEEELLKSEFRKINSEIKRKEKLLKKKIYITK